MMRGLAISLAALLLLGCDSHLTEQGQVTFESPAAAALAAFDAAAREDTAEAVRILGPEDTDAIVSADWKSERDIRMEIVAAAREKLEYELGDDGRTRLILGEKEWPFPFPLIEEEGRWRFDTEAGLEELINRRVGRNELAAIAIVGAYVDAQIEYALADRNGDQVREYAQHLASTPGERDGLYWETQEGEPESPFGPLVQGAEAYLDTLDPGDPLRGYYFEILKKQGGNPPGGGYDYVINSHMIAGFSLVAYPADYGNSGVMTFVVNHRGVIQQKDIGAFQGMDEYDPDDSWELVAESP
jgi:hypothetical protein